MKPGKPKGVTTRTSGPAGRGEFAWPPLKSLETIESLSTEVVVARLAALGVPVDEAGFRKRADDLDEAGKLTDRLGDAERLGLTAAQNDWLHGLVEILWERWIPERPRVEAIDDEIHAGYHAEDEDDAIAAAETWLGAWKEMLALADRRGLRTAEALEGALAHGHPLPDWLRDVGFSLWSAAEEDEEFARETLALAAELRTRFPSEPELVAVARWLEAVGRGALGESARVEALRTEWLASGPKAGHEWADWAVLDMMPSGREAGPEDLARAEALLRQGLETPGLPEKEAIYAALEDLLVEAGRDEEADALHERWLADEDAEPPEDDEEGEGEPVPQVVRDGPKVGRNDLCACGSGKKFKKCCGA